MNELNNAYTQCEKLMWYIYRDFIYNKDTKKWKASDFQKGSTFIGYEATARMSDLIRMYPNLFKVDKEGRYRTIELNPEEVDFIEKLLGIKKGDK